MVLLLFDFYTIKVICRRAAFKKFFKLFYIIKYGISACIGSIQKTIFGAWINAILHITASYVYLFIISNRKQQ